MILIRPIFCHLRLCDPKKVTRYFLGPEPCSTHPYHSNDDRKAWLPGTWRQVLVAMFWWCFHVTCCFVTQQCPWAQCRFPSYAAGMPPPQKRLHREAKRKAEDKPDERLKSARRALSTIFAAVPRPQTPEPPSRTVSCSQANIRESILVMMNNAHKANCASHIQAKGVFLPVCCLGSI